MKTLRKIGFWLLLTSLTFSFSSCDVVLEVLEEMAETDSQDNNKKNDPVDNNDDGSKKDRGKKIK